MSGHKEICVCGQAITPGRGVEWIHVMTRTTDCPWGGTSATPALGAGAGAGARR